MTAIVFRPVTSSDLDALLPVIRQFHADERIDWNEARLRSAMQALLDQPHHGRLMLIERDGAPAGYFAIGFCFSLEFGGRFGLLDELYVVPAQRGGGIGKRALEEAEAVCRAEGLPCVRLEVGDDNPHARGIYHRNGYAEHPRRLMTKWLDDAPAD